MLGEGREFQRRAFAQHHDRDRRLFAPALQLAQADNGDFAHLRAVRRPVTRSTSEEAMFSPPEMIMSFLRSVRYEKAVLVEIADIAAAKPVAEERGRGLLRILSIAAA